MRKIAILQPNYIPWKGVFDLIDRVDHFVFYDDVQYTKKDWRNRNYIKSKDSDLLLSVPVKTKGKTGQLIKDTLIDNDHKWQLKHYKSIVNCYKQSQFFERYHFILEELYLNNTWILLSELNVFSTKLISKAINIQTNWHLSSNLSKSGSKIGDKAIKICKELNCKYFINGPSSKKFLDLNLFKKNNIHVEFIKYEYPSYLQQYTPFSHNVSILDVIFNCGPNALKFIRNI